MNPKDLRELKLLEAFSDNNCPTQRELATELGISLGSINETIKHLVERGFFRVNPYKGGRNVYALTSKGIDEKRRLESEHQAESFEFYKISRSKLGSFFNALVQSDIYRVAFYGTGELAELAYLALQETPLKLVGVVDERNDGNSFFEHAIVSLNDLNKGSFQKLIITKDTIDEKTLQKITDSGFAEVDILLLV